MSTPTMSTDTAPTLKTGATIADAQLVVQILASGSAAGADRGLEILLSAPSPLTLNQLREAHTRLGDEYQQVMAFLGQAETIATFVKQGLLDEALIHDLLWVAGGWAASAGVCQGLREENGEPRLFANFEWLAKRAD
jgi:Domain of unknown function (DUF4760)